MELISSELTDLWCQGAEAVLAPGGEIGQLVSTLTGFHDGRPIEDPIVRARLETALASHDLPSCHTVANTIFPASMWRRERPRNDLYERYLRTLPRIKRSVVANRRGTYFGRLIDHSAGVNQLEHLVQTRLRGNQRRSAYFLSTLDLSNDHTDTPQLGFPCLHYICIVPESNGIGITGFYPMHHIFKKAYGNYLGLCRLGEFVATEWSTRVTRMTCVANIAKRDIAANRLRQNLEFIRG